MNATCARARPNQSIIIETHFIIIPLTKHHPAAPKKEIRDREGGRIRGTVIPNTKIVSVSTRGPCGSDGGSISGAQIRKPGVDCKSIVVDKSETNRKKT